MSNPTIIIPGTPGAFYSPPPLPSSITNGLETGVYKEMGKEFGLTGGADLMGRFENKPYLVPWVYRFDFMEQMVGITRGEGTPGQGGYTVFRGLPYSMPDAPNMLALTAQYSPAATLLDGQASPILYSNAVVVVQFRTPPFNTQGGQNQNGIDPNTPLPFCTQSIHRSGEFIQVPTKNLTFKSDSSPVASPISVHLQTATFQLVFQNLPYIPTAALMLTSDLINTAPMLGQAKGTLRFDSMDTVNTFASDGSQTQQVTVNFEWRQYDWNMFLREDKLVWDYVNDSVGNYPYAYGDLTPLLFEFAYPTNMTGGF